MPFKLNPTTGKLDYFELTGISSTGELIFGFNDGTGQPNSVTQGYIDQLVGLGVPISRIAWVDLGDGNGTVSAPAWVLNEILNAPTLQGIAIGHIDVSAFSELGTLSIPVLEGLVAPPVSTLTWTVSGIVADTTMVVAGRTIINTLSVPGFYKGGVLIVDTREDIETLTAPSLSGTMEVSSTLDWYVLSIS